MFSKFFSIFFVYNLFLLLSFSVSVNTLVNIQTINLLFYVFFHLTFIYFLFYYYNYTIFFLAFFYGVLFDIFLLNEIGPHLLSFIIIIFIFNIFKKFLFLLSPYQISITIFISLIGILFFDLIFAFIFNNIYFSFSLFMQYILISLVIFIPTIFLFNKLEK